MIFSRDGGQGLSYLLSAFVMCGEGGRADWGAKRAREFLEAVRSWPSRLTLVGTANGFFHAMIRNAPGPRPIWAWALEWNRQHRNMGFMGDDPDELIKICATLPVDIWTGERAYEDPERGLAVQRWRTEVPILPDVDDLFAGNWAESPTTLKA